MAVKVAYLTRIRYFLRQRKIKKVPVRNLISEKKIRAVPLPCRYVQAEGENEK